MAFYMLQKDVKQMKWCMDNYYNSFDYPDIPVYYEEALIVYQIETPEDEEAFIRYPISQNTQDCFEQYNQALLEVEQNRRTLALFEKQFGNAYWYYLNFVRPTSLQDNDEKNRY
jgi:hypothetical protein